MPDIFSFVLEILFLVTPAPQYRLWADAIITQQPVGTPVVTASEGETIVLKYAIVRAAVAMELLDARGVQDVFYCGAPLSFEVAVDYVRVFYHELKNEPPLSDAYLLPPKVVGNHHDLVALSMRNKLLRRLDWEWDRVNELTFAVKEIDRRLDISNCIEIARREENNPRNRRQALGHLKKLIGAADYAVMRLPCPVPEWCFEPFK